MNVKNLPDKVRLFTLNGATRDVAPGVVLLCSIKIEISYIFNYSQGTPSTHESIISLGVQASDHAGYTSFDLRPLKKFFAVLDRYDKPMVRKEFGYKGYLKI